MEESRVNNILIQKRSEFSLIAAPLILQDQITNIIMIIFYSHFCAQKYAKWARWSATVMKQKDSWKSLQTR